MKIRWHRHEWWLTDATLYHPVGNPNSSLSRTLLTYVCLGDHSHTKQVELEGHQKRTAETIFQNQKERIEAGKMKTDIPEAFKRAWDEKEL